jgi:selenide,water dikinase
VTEAARTSQVADRLLGAASGAAAIAMPSAADMLRAVFEARGLASPTDLITEIGAGATTLWKLNAAQTLVVSNTSREAEIDDAFECGRIAATAALSAVHACAAAPLFARLTCACPAGASDAARKSLLDGVAVAMSDAGAVLADAQLVDAATLRFEVLVAGVVRPDRIKGIAGAQAGDVLILASPLGTGIYAAAHAKQKLSDDERRVLIAEATRSNRVGITLGTIRNVHAVAEVGPGGLIEATLALAQAASLHATIDATHVPALSRALALAKTGCVAPASSRNWNRDGAKVDLADNVMPETRALLTDPQTSGALLISCKRDSVERVLKLCMAKGDDAHAAAAIGTLEVMQVTADAAPDAAFVAARRWLTITG